MLIKIHNSYRTVVAVCDSELLGKSFEKDKKLLDVKESFFNGEEKSEEVLVGLMQDLAKEDATFNIIGNKSVECALKAGIIFEDGISEIKGIKYALVLL